MMASCRVKRTVCVVVLSLMAVLGYVTAEVKDNDVDDSESVALMWGIADTTAAVGRVFRYHIPADAFKGTVSKYQVVEAGKDSLPSWLHFAPDLNVLKGIPTPKDAGQLYLEVIAYGSNHPNNPNNKATDVFSVFVNGDLQAMSSGQPLKFQKSGPEVVRCKREEPETVATIVVDADLDGLTVEQRLSLMTNFLAHMGLGEETVKMVPARARLLQDDTALVTGTGDVSEPQHPGVAVSWLVGCGKVEAGHFPVLHKLDDDSGTGVMGQALGHPVSGWRVTNTRLQQHALKRKRRQARATPTPVVTISPPTATDGGDGGAVDATDADTMTRKVVDMASPTFSIEPSPSVAVMPQTTTPSLPPATTPKTDKPDVIMPSKKPSTTAAEVAKTDPLPSAVPTTPKDTKPLPVDESTKRPPIVIPPVDACQRADIAEGVERLTLRVGEVVDFKIPENAFDACGKGGTSMTKLNLFKDTSTKLPSGWFLQFDQASQRLRGMPMADDVGTHTLTLVAMLKGTHNGFITTTTFKVVVRRPKGRKGRVNHEVALTIDTDYDDFVNNVDNKLDLADKVASVFGDENASALTVTSITRGSVVYAFTNNSLSGSSCPVDAITAMADKLVSADGKLNPEAAEKLKPWKLGGAALAPAGDCEGDPNFPARSALADPSPSVDPTMPVDPVDPAVDPVDPAVRPDKTPRPSTPMPPKNATEDNVRAAGKSEDDIWITTVVPAVVIVVLLLVALLVACVLYRKKRKGKMNLEDQNTFVNKGAPVIFPDELDEKPHDSSKPLLMEGSPPAPPPEYHGRQPSESPELGHRGGGGGGVGGGRFKENTPPTDEMDADMETDATSPLYQPPPPVTASSGKQARPHVQQPYRSQPPEIHP